MIRRLRAELAHIRAGLSVIKVPMKDGTTRYFDEARVYGEVMAAVRSSDESSPVFDLLREIDYDALVAADEGNEYINLFALAYDFAFDESGNRRDTPDLSERHRANNPPTPRAEGDALGAEMEARMARDKRFKALDAKTWSELDGDERRWVRDERFRRYGGRVGRIRGS